ncbi:MAG TPA: SH3-like domain-containing protein [Streptosporangiaceae bacterium]|nr:SH3-like domain-containing protein [Streptosporangiaceae bacterium]
MSKPAYAPGDRVRTRAADPPHHTRLPRYARGHTGVIVEPQGAWPRADDRARGVTGAPAETVYTVRFSARELWGSGSHDVTVDLWESYLEPAGEDR